MFSEDEIHQARAVPVLEIAERHGAKLRREGRELIGACPRCGGSDRFALWPAKNIWHCRGCRTGGGAIALEIHLGGGAFVDSVKTLIGKDAGTPTDASRRRMRSRGARGGTARRGRRGGAQRQQRSEDPRAPAADRKHAGRSLSARCPQDRCQPLGDQASAGGRRGARWCERICFWQPKPARSSTSSTTSGSAQSSGF